MERPPQMLQIVRESLNEGSEAAYRTIEEDAARICADLNCPNAHLAMESLTGPKEVWWLTRTNRNPTGSAWRMVTPAIAH